MGWRPDILLKKRGAGDRAGPSRGLDQCWRSCRGRTGARGSWLLTLGPSILLPGLTHRRPPDQQQGSRAPRAGTQGREEPVAPGTCQQGAGCGADRCPAPALWALLLQTALTLSPQTRVLLAWGGPGSYTSGKVIPSPACEYFINGLKIEVEPSAARGGRRRGAASVSGLFERSS